METYDYYDSIPLWLRINQITKADDPKQAVPRPAKKEKLRRGHPMWKPAPGATIITICNNDVEKFRGTVMEASIKTGYAVSSINGHLQRQKEGKSTRMKNGDVVLKVGHLHRQ